MAAWKRRHDSTALLTRAIQPLLWLMVFRQVFARLHSIPTGGIDYLALLAPGILAQSVLFVASFNGISVIWERDLGIVPKFLASAAPRTAPVRGKALYPTEIMPAWLKAIAHVNPLTYLVDGLRSMMPGLDAGGFGLAWDFTVLAAAVAVLVLVGGRMYPRLIT